MENTPEFIHELADKIKTEFEQNQFSLSHLTESYSIDNDYFGDSTWLQSPTIIVIEKCVTNSQKYKLCVKFGLAVSYKCVSNDVAKVLKKLWDDRYRYVRHSSSDYFLITEIPNDELSKCKLKIVELESKILELENKLAKYPKN